VDWPALVAVWQLAGQALVIRLQTLEQLSAWSGTPQADLAAYDLAITEYLDQIRATWQQTRDRWVRSGHDHQAGDFVERLVADPAEPPGTVMFTGFPGRAARPGEVRFYLTPDLSSYVDVLAEDVLHRVDLPAAQAPLGGQYVWARREPALLAKLEAAVAPATAAAAPVVDGPPWGAPAFSGNGAGDPVVSPFAHLATTMPSGDGTGFPDDEEDIPLPPGWPQPVK
jgi:hypothetical protein